MSFLFLQSNIQKMNSVIKRSEGKDSVLKGLAQLSYSYLLGGVEGEKGGGLKVRVAGCVLNPKPTPSLTLTLNLNQTPALSPTCHPYFQILIFFYLYLEEWLPRNMYDVFWPKEFNSEVKNIEKSRDCGTHWPGTSIF